MSDIEKMLIEYATWHKLEDEREYEVRTAIVAEFKELETDAARYQWLRGTPLMRHTIMAFGGTSLKVGTELDTAIDAQMLKSRLTSIDKLPDAARNGLIGKIE